MSCALCRFYVVCIFVTNFLNICLTLMYIICWSFKFNFDYVNYISLLFLAHFVLDKFVALEKPAELREFFLLVLVYQQMQVCRS